MAPIPSAKPAHTFMWRLNSLSVEEYSVSVYPDLLVWHRSSIRRALGHQPGDERTQTRNTFLREGPLEPTPHEILGPLLACLSADPALASRWAFE